MLSEIQKILKQDDYLRGQRGNADAYRQDVCSFVLPRKAWITTPKVNGARLQDDFLYDSRANLALKEAATGFHSKLTNPASRWYESRTRKEKLMQSGSVQRYFKEVDDIQFEIINSSNFNSTMLEFYTDDLSIGVAMVMTEEDHRRHVRYTEVPIEQVNWELDDCGDLSKIYRTFKWSAYKCQSRWKEKITPEMKKALEEEKGFTMFEILHYVGKRYVRNASKKDNVNMEFESKWLAKKEEIELEDSGFIEMPYELTRFWVHSDDDTMGYSPAMDVLAAIKTVNAEKRTIIRAGQKATDPAYVSPARFWVNPLNANPNAMNYYDATKFKLEQFGRMPGGENVRQGVELMQMEQDLIDRGFFLPLFRALSDVRKEMTVPEVQQRIIEGLGLIGPVVGRMTNTIESILIRTYGVLDRRLLFPIPPKEIQGEEMGVIFLSPLAKAQRSAEINGLQAWIQFIGAIAQGGMPNVLDKINGDRVVDISRDLYGVDPTAVNEDEQVKQVRVARQQAQQQAMKLQMAETASGSARDMAAAHKDVKEANKT